MFTKLSPSRRSWWIRVLRSIRCTIVPLIHRQARINRGREHSPRTGEQKTYGQDRYGQLGGAVAAAVGAASLAGRASGARYQLAELFTDLPRRQAAPT